MKSVEVNPGESDEIVACFERGELLVGFDADEKKEIAKLTLATIRYLEREMASTLGSKVIVVGNIFESQPVYHLDMFLTPAPNNVIFIQDHDLCCQVINDIEKHYKDINPQVKDRLDDYKRSAKQKQEKYGEQFRQIANLLSENGFTVIPLPGIYYPEKGAPVNFMNSIIGVGKRGAFSIINGSSHPADLFLRDAFTQFLNHYDIKRTYFTGRKTVVDVPEDLYPLTNYFIADMNAEGGGGIHCLTQTIDESMGEIEFNKSGPTKLPPKVEYIVDTLPKFWREMLAKSQSRYPPFSDS